MSDRARDGATYTELLAVADLALQVIPDQRESDPQEA